MKALLFAVCAVGALATLGQEGVPKKSPSDMTPEELAARKQRIEKVLYERTGGQIVKPGTMSGKVVFANAQNRVAEAVIQKDAAFIAKALKIQIDAVKGNPVGLTNADAELERLGAQVGVFIVDDEKDPHALLLAPESRWAIVNVAPLAADGATGEKLAGRLRKEIGRGFGLASGAFNSKFEWTILGPVTKARDLDRIPEYYLTADIQPRIMPYLAELGVRPYELKTYRRACVEGWAPDPTNDVQRAIMESVRSEKERGPANGLKIVPPKK